MVGSSEGSKSRLAKAAGAEPSGQMRDEKLHTVVARSTCGSEKAKNTTESALLEVELSKQVHAAVAQATFRSQNVQSTDHFSKLRCSQSARRCGAKHMSKSKCTKHTTFKPLLEVEMSKKCVPLHISKTKCTKTRHVQSTFRSCDVQKVHAVVARSTFRSQNVQSTPASEHFWKLRSSKSVRCCGVKGNTCSRRFWTLKRSFVAGARDSPPCQK